MTNASVVSAWQDASGAHLAVSVLEAGGKTLEYIGTVDNATFVNLPDVPTKKAALIAAVKLVRDAQQNPVAGAIAGVNGVVVI